MPNCAECETKPTPARVHFEDARIACRNHLESIQNLWYLATLEADKPHHVRLHLHVMGRHLNRLSAAMLKAERTVSCAP
jgi:recombinational DNA repair protein (RecF pathway)